MDNQKNHRSDWIEYYNTRSGYSPPRDTYVNHYPPPPDRLSPPAPPAPPTPPAPPLPPAPPPPPLPPSSSYDRYGPPSSVPWKRRYEEEKEDDRRRAETQKHNMRRLFEGLTFYVHLGSGKDQDRESRRLQGLIKKYGGDLCKKPDSYLVTHIIISFSPTTTIPKNAVSLIDKYGNDLPPRFGEWNTKTIINHLSRIVVPHSSYSEKGRKEQDQSGRKYVVRKQWLDECLSRRRLMDLTEEFGGWEVKGTYDPSLINDHTSFTRRSPTENSCQSRQPVPQDPRKLLRKSQQVRPSPPSGNATVEKNEVNKISTENTSFPEVSAHIDSHVMIPEYAAPKQEVMLHTEGSHERHDSVELEDIEVGSIKKEREDVFDTLDIKPITDFSRCEDNLESELSHDEGSCNRTFTTPPIPKRTTESRPTVLGEEVEIPTIGSTLSPPQPTQSRSIANPISTASPPPTPTDLNQEKKIFARGLIPLTFHVIGSGREKRFTEMIISERGGIIASSTYATLYIIPISPDEPIDQDFTLRTIISGLRDQPGRLALSVDWIEHCIERNKLLCLEKYVIQLQDVDTDLPTPPPSSNHSEGHKRSLSILGEYEEVVNWKRSRNCGSAS